MRVGPYQAVGLLGIALFAIGAALAVVLPQMSSVRPPVVLTWALTGVGAVLFWMGVFGSVAEALRGAGERPRSLEGPRPR